MPERSFTVQLRITVNSETKPSPVEIGDIVDELIRTTELTSDPYGNPVSFEQGPVVLDA